MIKHKLFWTTYTLTAWTTAFVCYLKYNGLEHLSKYHYRQLLAPFIIISIIYFIEAYYKMIKSKIDGNNKTGRDS